MPTTLLVMTVVVVALSLAFGLVNGFRDAPNAIALPVRSRALTPGSALVLAAAMNAVGGVLSGGLLSTAWAALPPGLYQGGSGLLLGTAALLGAVGWGLFAWARGMPVSMTHSLLAGLVGGSAALAITGDHGIDMDWWWGLVLVVTLGLVVTPGLAWLLSWLLVTPAAWLGREAATRTVNRVARMALSVTGAANALGHGVQSGQRVSFGLLLAFVPAGISLGSAWWIPVLAGGILGLGTLLGGWRIAHTLTERIVVLDPLRSAVASTVSALLLFAGSYALHLPLSSTHATVGAIAGAGQNQRYTAVRWQELSRIASYWVVTFLACGGAALLLAAAGTPLL
ncbi:inorganic phosphate transporter [Citricoccus sp. SGAir0253]|uniref:inorganic phosphate transporter n=1 Tax=Citricoccus sp. SGAir0253 TaxID=2567881 RepID=UPI0010CD5148|nr:inorganic phosphate transporter [Citricoccus sp. SGAir0253]QCU76871.1 inorganic phosphate transporter [Citricoccus sp. SGAir0253]